MRGRSFIVLLKNNDATFRGGGIHTFSGTLTDCIITGNTAVSNGGGMNYSPCVITNCIFYDNESIEASGGALNNCQGDIINCLVYGNTAGYGGGISYCGKAILNCTIADNTSTNAGGGLRSCSAAVTNCIVWGNSPDELYDNTGVFEYNCINGWSSGGTGNISDNPQFVDSAGFDYHLLVGSLCIDVGDSTGDYNGQVDIEGNPRVVDLAGFGDSVIDVDMGAYELNPPLWTIQVFIQGPVPVSPGWMLDGDSTWRSSGYTYTGLDPAYYYNVIFREVNYWLEPTGGWVRFSDSQPLYAMYTDLTKYVSTTGNDSTGTGTQYFPYRTIQHGIDNCTSPGGRVYVYDGSYSEAINFYGKAITVEGEDQSNCKIRGNGNVDDSNVSFWSGESSSSVLKNFSIENGKAYLGGGIYISGSSPTIQQCTVRYNGTPVSTNVKLGGGICIEYGSPLIEYCTFYDNSAIATGLSGSFGLGGAIYTYDTTAVFNFCTIGGVPDNNASDTWIGGLPTHEIATNAPNSSLRPTYNYCGIKGLTNGNSSITGTRMYYYGYTPIGSNNYVIP